jgi:hypothetical protein
MTPSQANRTPKADPRRAPGECYTPRVFAHAVKRACRKAGVPSWHLHQVRHAAGTNPTNEFGLDAAGHPGAFEPGGHRAVRRGRAGKGRDGEPGLVVSFQVASALPLRNDRSRTTSATG